MKRLVQNLDHLTRVIILLVAQVTYILMLPFASGRGFSVTRLLFTAMVVAVLNIAASSRRTLIIALVLALPALGLKWTEILDDSLFAVIVNEVSVLLLLIFVLVLLLGWIRLVATVGVESILIAISTYLMLGFIWVHLYLLVDLVTTLEVPVFNRIWADPALYWADVHYFSFVTLTTLGYGDITPVTAMAKSLAILEAMTGAIFLAVLVAYLVGLHVSSAAVRKAEK